MTRSTLVAALAGAAALTGCFNPRTGEAWYGEFLAELVSDARYDATTGELHVLYAEEDGLLHHGVLGKEDGARLLMGGTPITVGGEPVRMFEPGGDITAEFRAVAGSVAVAPRPDRDEVWVNLAGRVGWLDDSGAFQSSFDLESQSDTPSLAHLVFYDEDTLLATTNGHLGATAVLDGDRTPTFNTDYRALGDCGMDVAGGLAFYRPCQSQVAEYVVDVDDPESKPDWIEAEGDTESKYFLGSFDGVPVAAGGELGLFAPQTGNTLCLLPIDASGRMTWTQRKRITDEQGCHGAVTWWTQPLLRADISPDDDAMVTVLGGGIGMMLYDEGSPPGASGDMEGSWCAIDSTGGVRLDLVRGEAPVISSNDASIIEATGWSDSKGALTITYAPDDPDVPGSLTWKARRVNDTLVIKVPHTDSDWEFQKAGYASITGTYLACPE